MKDINKAIYQLPPREENNFRGARQFMHRWDFFKAREAPSALGLMRIRVNASPSGNINIAGTNRSSLSVIFIPSQDGFLDAIEPGVRNLVKFFAIDLDFITYTSCEGHYYRERHEADERHVGILPRNDAERSTIWGGFTEASTEWNQRCIDMPMIVGIMEGAVRDGHALLPTLDLYLAKRSEATWDFYFSAVDLATVILIDILRSGQRRRAFDLKAGKIDAVARQEETAKTQSM